MRRGWSQTGRVPRRLFEMLRLEIRYDHRPELAIYRVTLTGGSMGDIADLAGILPGGQPEAAPRKSEEKTMVAETMTPPAF
ncbi:hypothetical protein IQ63_14185 [Streptomyces acidiscabies]|uniref:Uncharacterized protein n=2 Tax=Streptomyces acidiscabies TaxID=42234 RepID=A0A0L0KCH3_9ACTN|nr:hypothetical protein IQ63_14185 [Streptomyces acidiscabies]